MLIYLAGPFGFSEAGRKFHNEVIKRKLSGLGHDLLDPWALTDPAQTLAASKKPYGQKKRQAWKLLNVQIGENNTNAIDRCEAVFAVLDGTDVDSGTASEIGYAFARQKPILGYRGDFRLSADNEGAVVNLQVEYFIRRSGGTIIFSIEEIADGIKIIEKIVSEKS